MVSIAMPRTRLFLLLVIALAMGASACSRKPQTEAEQYAELRGSFKYRTYQALSRTALPLAISAYNEQIAAEGIADAEKLDEGLARVLLAFVWTTSLKPDLALAETELAMAHLQSPDERFLIHSLTAIALYEKGWSKLAQKESAAGEAVYADVAKREQVRLMKLASYLVMGSLAVYESDFDAAQAWFGGLEVETGFSWPTKCVAIVRDFHGGDIQGGLRKTRALADDDTLPRAVRDSLRDLIEKVEAEHGSIDSSLFMPRLISRIAWQTVVSSTDRAWRRLGAFIDEAVAKLGMGS